MKLRLPVRLKLAVLAGLRSVAQATLASGFLAVGAVFFSFSAQAEDDPLAVAVEDEDETAVLLDEEASDAALAGAGVAEAALDDSQAAALAEAEQEHAAELGINATSSAVSQAAIAAQDATVSPAQAAGGSHADSFVIVSVPDASALTLPAAEGAVAPSLCAEGAADSATSITPVKTASVAVLPQASSSLTLSEDVVMASSPVAEATQTSSSSAAVAATSSSSGGAVACGCGAAGGSSGGGAASYSLTSSSSDSSSSSLVITTPIDDTSSDPIAEEVLEDSTTEDITTSTLPGSSASTLATTTSSSTTTRTLPALKLLGSTEATTVTISDAQIWDENSEIPTAGSNVNVGGASASLEINTNGVELGLLRLYNGGDVTVDSGSEVNITQVRVHDSWSKENEVLRVSGVLNISHENSDKGYTNAALLIGHWSAGSGAVQVLSGGKLNVLSGWTHVSKDTDGFLEVKTGAVANLRGIVYYNSSAHDATVTIEEGGRMNVGEYGVYDASGASSHTLCLNGGTLGVLSADGAAGNIVWEDCAKGPRVSVTENSVLDTAVVTSAGTATGGVGTMKFGTVAVSDGKVLTVQGGGRVMVKELQLTKDSSLHFIDSTGFEGKVNLQISIGDLSTVKHVNASGVEVAAGENYYTWGTFAKSTDFLNGLTDSSSVTYVWNGTGEVVRQSDDGQYVYNVFDKDYVIVNVRESIDTSRTKSSVTLMEGAGELKMTSVSQFNLAPITVCQNSTLNINGKVDECFSVILNGGVLKNAPDSSGSCGEEHRQINALSLTAASKLQVDSTFGLISSEWGANTLDLGGYTLTKAGTAEYLAISTALRGGGTLKVTQGTFNLKSRDNKPAATLGAVSDSTDTNIWLTAGELAGSFTMNRAAEFKMDDEDTSVSGSASITATITNVDKIATFRVADDDVLTFSGSMKGNDTSSGSLIKAGEGKLLMSGQENKIANLTVQGGEVEISGTATFTGALTLSGSGVAKNTGAVTLNSSSGNKSFLTQMTGDGEIILASDATLTNTDSTQATGKLTINSGVTLTLGTNESHTVSIASFSSIDLAGSIKAQNKSESFNNLSVGSSAEGAIFSKDMGSSDDGCLMTFAGTTKVDGTLRIENYWNAQFKIDKLTGSGSGSLEILARDENGTAWQTSSRQPASYTLSDVSNFGGSVTVDNSNATVNVTLGKENANVEADFTKTHGMLNLTVDATTTLSGTVSGAAITINEGKALDITGNVTTSGSVTNSGSLTVSSGGTLTGDVSGSLTVSSGGVFVGDVSGGTFTLNGVWDLTKKEAYTSGNLAAFLAKVSEGSGTVQLSGGSSKTYLLGKSVDSKGLDLSFIGSDETVINGWENTKAVLSISRASTLSTEGELRVESTATVQVQDGGAVKVGGKLNLGHSGGGNYGHFSLEGGQLIAQGVGQTSSSDAEASTSNTFTMTDGILTLTRGGDEVFSGVYTVISGGTLDTSKAAWGITSSADGSVSVGRVTVSDVYTTEEGTIANSGNALTLTGANITGDITLDGKADLNLKNVTVTGENVTVGGDNRTISVAEGSLTVEKSVTTKGLLQVQEDASLVLLNGDAELVTITKQTDSATAAEFNGGMTLKYDTVNSKGVISGATISKAAIDVSQGSVLALSNSTLNSGVITLNSNAVLELASTADSALAGSIASAENATGTTLRVSGTAVETTLSGTVDVAVSDIKSGTLTFNGSSASLGALTVGAEAVLNAAGSSQTLNLSAVVENQGTLSLGGVSTLTFTVSDVFDSFSYTDTVTGPEARNGFIDRYWLIRNSGNGAIENLSVDNVTVNGASRTATISDTTGLYAAVGAEDIGLTAGTNLNSIYVVNEGNVVYNDTSSNSSGNDTVKQLWLTGGTLELAQSDIKSEVGVHVKQDSTVNIGTNRTLKDSQVSSVANGATLTLTGSGTYSISAGKITSMTSGVAVGTGESGFTGTVLLNYGVKLADADLNAFANGSSSSVKINGVSGTLKSGDISTNLVLEDYKKDSVEQSALAISGGTEKITFSGGISGGGKMEITPIEGTPADITFSGDISEWTGGISGGKGIANLTFTGDATKVHAAVSKMAVSATDILNVFIDASADRTFTRGISANSLKLIGGDTVKTVSVKGNSVQYYGSVDLKDKNVILQVSGTGNTFLCVYDAELAVGGSSGIDIADNFGKALTTLRTNTHTQDASSSGGATLSSCMFIYNNSTCHAEITGYNNTVIDRAVIDVVNGSTLELNDVVLSASTWLHDEETTGDGDSTSTYTGSVILNGVEGKVTGTGASGDSLVEGTVLTKTGTDGNGEGNSLTLQSDAKVFKITYSQITQMGSIGGTGTGLTLDFDTYDGGKGFASLYETLNGKYDYVAIEFDSTVKKINFSTLVVNAKITNGEGKAGTTTGYYVGGTDGVVNSNGTSGVVVYFDAMALPEPTTSTLGLLALTALCARRRRTQATR